MAMNLIIQGLRMNEGTGDTSYAKTAYIQKQVLLSTKSMREEALKDFYLKNLPSTLCIADLGCSSAEQNTFTVALELIENIENARQKLGYRPLDYQVNLNDLPNNDFNTLFKSLESFKEKLEQKSNELGQCFVCGVPGSFYGRLFPDNSLHFVHSSYSLHWLSQMPDGIEENKKSIYLSKASSTRVLNAYYEQFIEDFTTFLSCRSKEVIGGGKMQLTIIGRRCVQPFSKECSQVWDLLATVLNEMTSEGFIEEKKLNTFNIPNYYPSPLELKTLVEREGSFIMDQINTFETKWNNDYENSVYKDPSSYDFVKCIRSVVETMLINCFGEEVIDEIFIRYQKVVHSSMIKEENAFINHSLLLIKK